VNDEAAPVPVETAAALSPDEVGPVAALDLLYDEARSTVEQQVELAKAFATAAGVTARSVAIFAIVSVLLALVALMSIAIGLLLAIASSLGILAATGLVGGALLLLAGMAALMVRRAIRRFQAAASGSTLS
jgi:hypothetical protein